MSSPQRVAAKTERRMPSYKRVKPTTDRHAVQVARVSNEFAKARKRGIRVPQKKS